MSFSTIIERIKEFLKVLFRSLEPSDIFDILLVAIIIYGAIVLVRDSRAEQLIKGIALFIVMFLVSSLFNLKSLNYLLGTIFDNILIVLIVIFQPELRRALEQIGHSSAKGLSFINIGVTDEKETIKSWEDTISAISQSVAFLQEQRTGALIVCERSTKLGDIIKTGTVIDAKATPEIIENIFFTNAPLHDGAMIIREGRVYAAGCILPLSENFAISKELGTRHRAAVGISENSDAVAIIVSEETGLISIAVGGDLKRNYSPKALQVTLGNYLIWDSIKREEPEGTSTKKSKRKKRAIKNKRSKSEPQGGDDNE